MNELGPKFRPGVAQKQNHYLVLPLAPSLHLELDGGSVAAWESRYYRQLFLLERLSRMLGYCVFDKAGIHEYEYRNFDRPGAAQS